MKKIIGKLLGGMALALAVTVIVFAGGKTANAESGSVRILFTHDMHSYFDTTNGIIDGVNRQYGNIAKLSTLLQQEKTDNSVYVDAGDIAMGTLYQAGFSTDAYELRMLGKLGCSYVTFGNHEFDYGCDGVTGELEAALSSGGFLPKIVESSFNFDGTLTEEQARMKATLEKYGWKESFIEEIGGIKVGFFGIEGPDSIECVQSDVDFYNYIEVANRMVSQLRDQCDLIVCLSHTGTSGDGENGEDFDMLKEVKGIDVVISGHSHTAYKEPVIKDDTILVSSGSYLQYLGELDVNVAEDGKVSVAGYRIIPIDENVEEDPEIRDLLNSFKKRIKDGYLVEYAGGGDYDDVLTRSDYTLISLDEMYATHQEYTMGNIIADSYIYEAKQNGINDIDVALVGLGTIRGSITEGYITLSDCFEICSLGVGGDGSAGHPLLSAYITGEELKLLCELDASLGPMVSSIKMSYSGLNYKFNSNRAILDRVTDIYLVRPDGRHEVIKDNLLYKVCCNMYAANMLGMLNGLTNGILSIVPKDVNGQPIEDFYSVALLDTNGNEIKEWVALRDFLKSFSGSKLPKELCFPQGRKVDTNEHGLKVLEHPGLTTWIFCFLGWVVIVLIALLGRKIFKKAKKRKAANKPI